jgi:hypothetical protein
MTTPDLFDVVELLADMPQHDLRAGARGAVVHCHADGTYEVEFANDEGETVAWCALSADQLMVIWQAATRTWRPLSEQVATLIVNLPNAARQEVLDFARFLVQRTQPGQPLRPSG